MALRTYGDKPISFQVEENGEYYCIGSEVRQFLMNTNREFDFQLFVLILFRSAITYDCFAGPYTNGTQECSVGPSQMMKEND